MKMRLILVILILVLKSCSFANRKNSDKTQFKLTQSINDNDKLISRVVKKYNKDIIKSPYVARAYFREKAKCQGCYAMLTEGYGYIFSAGYKCEVPVDNFSFLCENMRKSDRKKCWLNRLILLYEKVPQLEKQTDIAPGYNSLFSGFRWFEKHGPLSSNSWDHYHYKLDTAFSAEGLGGIVFNPIDNASYSGIVYFKRENFRIDHVVLNRFDFYSNPFWSNIEVTAIIDYEYCGDMCYLSSMKIYYENEGLQHWVEFVVTTPPKATETNENEYRILFRNDNNPIVKYNKSDWDKFNFPQGNDINSIRKDLSIKRSLEDQYISNSGKKYYIQTLKFGKVDDVNYDFVQTKIQELQKLFSH